MNTVFADAFYFVARLNWLEPLLPQIKACLATAERFIESR
jgi:hypothetical protein